MGGFGDALEKMVMSHFFNITRYASRIMYVGLSSADPLDTGAGASEPPTAKGYARRKTFNVDATSWQVADATGTTIDNAVAIEFPAATVVWGTMTHFAIYSGNTAGASVLVHGQLTTSKLVEVGDTARFAIGELDICLK